MAKGKKSKSKGYISKGERPNVSRKWKNPTDAWTRHVNKFKGWQEGRPVSVETLMAYGPRTTAEKKMIGKLRKEMARG